MIGRRVFRYGEAVIHRGTRHLFQVGHPYGAFERHVYRLGKYRLHETRMTESLATFTMSFGGPVICDAD